MSIDFVPRLARDGQRLLAVASAHGDRTPVPTCPGMDLGELVRHLGSVWGLVLRWSAEGARPDSWDTAPPDGIDVHGWAAEVFTELVHRLGAHDSQEPCSTWSPADQSWGFWARRMAAETLIHRYDVENAVGAPSQLDPRLAADGVAEVMTLWLPMKTTEDPARPAARVKISCGAATWTAEVDEYGGGVLDPRFAGHDAEVSGSPAALDLWLWGRTGDDTVQISGDLQAVATFRAALRSATG